MRHRNGRGPIVAALFYIGSLFPALGYVNVFPMQYSFVADHFAYLPSIGLIVLIVAAATRGFERLVRMEVLFPAAAPAAVVILLGVLALATANQGLVYQDMPTLWRDTLTKTDQKSWMAANNYGVWLRHQGTTAPRGTKAREDYFDAAVQWFRKTIRLKPDHAAARYNLGLISEHRGQLDEALAFFDEAIRYEPMHAQAWLKRGELLTRLGKPDEAMKAYLRVVELERERPESALAYLARYHRGEMLERAGKHREAGVEYYQALQIYPESVAAHVKLGNALMMSGDVTNALQAYAQVVRLDPTNAPVRNNLGRLFAAMEPPRLNEAAAQFELAIQYNPKFAEAHNNLGQVFLMQGRVDDAIKSFENALALVPKFERARKNLEEAQEFKRDPKRRPSTRWTFAPATAPSTGPATEPSE